MPEPWNHSTHCPSLRGSRQQVQNDRLGTTWSFFTIFSGTRPSVKAGRSKSRDRLPDGVVKARPFSITQHIRDTGRAHLSSRRHPSAAHLVVIYIYLHFDTSISFTLKECHHFFGVPNPVSRPSRPSFLTSTETFRLRLFFDVAQPKPSRCKPNRISPVRHQNNVRHYRSTCF